MTYDVSWSVKSGFKILTATYFTLVGTKYWTTATTKILNIQIRILHSVIPISVRLSSSQGLYWELSPSHNSQKLKMKRTVWLANLKEDITWPYWLPQTEWQQARHQNGGNWLNGICSTRRSMAKWQLAFAAVHEHVKIVNFLNLNILTQRKLMLLTWLFEHPV